MNVRGALIASSLLSLAVVGCQSCACGAPAPVAELTSFEGQVQRDRAASPGAFTDAEVGASFQLEEAVRTGPEATARVALTAGGALDVSPATIVRFSASHPGSRAPRIGVETGEAVLTIDDEAVFDTQLGLARLSSGSRVRLRAHDRGGQLEVIVGRAEITRGDERVSLGPDESVFVDIHGAIIDEPEDEGPGDVELETGELEEPEPPVDAAGPDDDAGSPDSLGAPDPAESEAPDARVFEESPARVDLVVRAGTSATIHDSGAPTHVGLQTDCPTPATVELTRRGAPTANYRGEGRVHLRLAVGAHRYRVLCAGEETARGTLRVRRDTGRGSLAQGVPRTRVDADGRRYTVLYQNRLPEITARWRDAPPGPYVLHLVRGSSERTQRLTSARHTYGSGELGEGTYRYHFTAGDGQASPTGTLRVQFDNAARAAYVSAPPGDIAAGASTVVQGGVIRGASVSIGGVPVELDGQRRFSVTASVPPDRDALAVRVAHPSGGVHFYLRRVRSTTSP